MAKTRHANMRPSQAEGGGNIGFPVGAKVKIIEAQATTWEEAGEGALKGGRKAEDPALKLVGESDGWEEPKTEFLGAGKANRLVPSKDGEFFDIAEESTATALSDSSNTRVFLDSIFYDPANKKKSAAFKQHGDQAINEEVLDEGFTAALVGLEFVVGRKAMDRDFGDQGEGRGKPRPTLVAEEIISGPGGKKSGSKKKGKDEDDDADEDEKPAKTSGKSKKPADDDDDTDVETAAEKAVVEALDLPKYRKGLPTDRAFNAVFTLVKAEENAQEIMKLIEDEKWLKAKARPWAYDKEEDALTAS